MDNHRRRTLSRVFHDYELNLQDLKFLEDLYRFVNPDGLLKQPPDSPARPLAELLRILRVDTSDAALSYEERTLVKDDNNKILAIKSFRARTECGLKEAKDVIDDYAAGLKRE